MWINQMTLNKEPKCTCEALNRKKNEGLIYYLYVQIKYNGKTDNGNRTRNRSSVTVHTLRGE